jgi:VIT1/CCC1 family predicted Fe2+/Mn2+ transporter
MTTKQESLSTMTSHVHFTHRSGWLRAAVLGANDGVLSLASLMLGVAAAHTNASGVWIAGLAGLFAGALSMASGEYVSVSSQADTERADLDVERHLLQHDYDSEHLELRDIYIQRGLEHELATQVAHQLMAHDAIGAHARDEIGITDALSARPLTAAVTSGISFTIGGVVPLLADFLAPEGSQIIVIAAVSLIFLTVLGAIAARAGGASMRRGALRMLVWGGLAMGVTSAAGAFLGASV